jgi:hypothetical protein
MTLFALKITTGDNKFFSYSYIIYVAKNFNLNSALYTNSGWIDLGLALAIGLPGQYLMPMCLVIT